MITFSFLVSIISTNADSISLSLGLLRWRAFINSYFTDLSIHSKEPPFDDFQYGYTHKYSSYNSKYSGVVDYLIVRILVRLVTYPASKLLNDDQWHYWTILSVLSRSYSTKVSSPFAIFCNNIY